MNTIPWFDESLAFRLVQALVHFLWQGSLVAGVVLLAGTTLTRASAHARYWFYVMAMGVMVACPPVTYGLLGSQQLGEQGISVLERPPAPGALGRPAAGTAQSAGGSPVGIPGGRTSSNPSSERGLGGWLAPLQRWFLSRLTPLAPSVLLAYILGVAAMTLRLTTALYGGRQLCQSAIPIGDDRLLAMIEREIRRMGVKVAPAVAFCERISLPIIVGIVKPAILLPAALTSGLSPDQLQALLAHELAHIRRFDLVVNLLQRLAEAVLFFHPAVWFVSRRVSMEREIAADDMVIAAGWQPVQYADALVRMAELSSALRRTHIVKQGAALAVLGRHESEFKRRVLRLIAGDDLPMLRLKGAGWTLYLTVIAVFALTPLFVQAWTPPKGRPQGELIGQGQTAASPQKPAKLPPSVGASKPQAENVKLHHPRIIMAEHVLLWDNQIVTWEQIVERLRSIRKSGPFRATFYSTNGFIAKRPGGEREYHDRIFKIYREIFEPVGVSFASMSPRGSARVDAIRTAADLLPNRKRAVAGQVVTPTGESAPGAQVIVLPTDGQFAGLDVALSGTEMRDPLDEEWSPTDERGHFVVHPKEDSYVLAVLHPTGVATQASPAKDRVIRLQPWATIAFTSTGNVADQHADVSIRPPGIGPSSPGYHIYSIKTEGNPALIKVPAGEISVYRSLEMKGGVSINTPVESFPLTPGETRVIELKDPSPADRKRAEEVFKRLHPS
jgi:beta-lactamase regulating signal transducer with metallopeptidase domain